MKLKYNFNTVMHFSQKEKQKSKKKTPQFLKHFGTFLLTSKNQSIYRLWFQLHCISVSYRWVKLSVRNFAPNLCSVQLGPVQLFFSMKTILRAVLG